MPRFEVQDFGPISKAAIDLKPLTIFLGPNNSGKSYLALVIYSLSRTLLGYPPDGRLRWPQIGRRYTLNLKADEVKRASSAIMKKWPTAKSLPSRRTTIQDLPLIVQDIMSSTLRRSADALSFEFGRELKRCYGTEVSSLLRRGTSVEKTDFGVKLSDDLSGFSWEMRSRQEDVVVAKWNTRLPELSFQFGHELPPLRFMRQDADFVLHMMMRGLPEAVFSKLVNRAHYLPASRSGILLGHKTLASLIVGRSSLAWVEPMEIPRLPGVITDLIQALLLLGRGDKPNAKLQKVVAFLEGKVTRGTVNMDTRVEYPEVFYENESGRFKLHQVSSMVSEIAPLILFLKYLVRPGDLFIIEEPESHLDSDNQRKLARAIAMLVRTGVKVLVTTHSDFFINQLSNLLLLSQLSARRRAARGYGAIEVLQAADVGAYRFHPSDDGTQVETLEVTPTGGIPSDIYASVHADVYDEATQLEHLVQ